MDLENNCSQLEQELGEFQKNWFKKKEDSTLPQFKEKKKRRIIR